MNRELKERELLAEKRCLEAEIAERQEALKAVEVLIHRVRRRDGLPVEEGGPSFTAAETNGKQRRTRGTLKAARSVLKEFAGREFERDDLLRAIEESNSALAGKVNAAAIRGVVRTLLGTNEITESSASPGKYRTREAAG